MISPWKDWLELDTVQRVYEAEQFMALTAANEELTNTMAAIIDEVYTSDVAEIEEE